MSAALKIGFIGLGDMGGTIARRLLAAGVELHAYDVRDVAVKELVELGAVAASTPAAVATAAEDALIICVVNDDQVWTVVGGPDGVLEGLQAPCPVVLHSSVLPATARDLAAALDAVDIQFVDAPVSGARAAAERGTLTVMAGGDPVVVDKLRPLLSLYAECVVRVGDAGAGQAMKLVNNIMLHVNHLVALEAMTFGKALGLEESMMLDIVNRSTGRSWATENWGPLDDMLTSHTQAGEGIYQMFSKEMWHALEVGRAEGLGLPLTGVGTQVSMDLLRRRGRILAGETDS